MRVTLAGREYHAGNGATVFIPHGNWISVANVSSEPAMILFFFNKPAFEQCLRAMSSRPSETFTMPPPGLEIADYDPTTGFLPLRPHISQSSESFPIKWQKAPLRLVVRRTEIRGDSRVLYYVEQLECGHSHTEFLGANPIRRRRRCQACKDGVAVVVPPNERATECIKEEAAGLRILFA